MKIVKILGKSNLRSYQIKEISEKSVLEVFDTNVKSEDTDEVISRIGNAEIILVNAFTPINQKVISCSKSLRYIVSCSAGINHIDLEACQMARIYVKWYASYCARTLAEKAFAYILLAMNRLLPAFENVRNKQWDYLSFQGRELPGKNIGILGYGTSGKIVGQFSRTFGMNVLWTNSKSSTSHVQEVLSKSDILSLHMALNNETKHFINRERLSYLKNDVVLINTARGQLIDENALYDFLNDHKEAYAVLDVLEHEPPEINYPLISLPNIAVTPHIGWNSFESDEYLAHSVYEDLVSAIEDKWKL